MTYTEIVAIIEIAKSMGVSHLKYQDLELHYQDNPVASVQAPPKLPESPTPVPDKTAEELIKPMSVLDQMSPEEILYYATPYYDELQAEKEAHMQKLKEQE